jgi:2-dehydropantoate 2-reductase
LRFVVHGAGGIGGVVGGRLVQSGHDVVFVARGAHADAMETSGLVIESAEGRKRLDVEVVRAPDEVVFTGDDVVLLAMKSQDTLGALDDLDAVVSPDIAIACLQNGVENERAALRRFENVYGVCVMCPTGHLEPGVVQAFSSPTTGMLDVGRYPSGVDATVERLVDAFNRSTFHSLAREDVMYWKYCKLLMNLGNAIEALCGPEARQSELATLVRDEGVACLRAAGIPFASPEEDAERRDGHLRVRVPRAGGSTWQSLERRAGSVETDYLNGEIVLLGREHGVPTPANALLQRLMAEAVASGAGTATLRAEDLLARVLVA